MNNYPNYACMCPACMEQRPIPEIEPNSRPDAKRSYFTLENGKLLFKDILPASFIGANAKPVFTTEQIVQQLRTQWGFDPDTVTISWKPRTVINYSTPTTPLQNGEDELSGFSAVSSTRKASVKDAFELWNDLISPSFVEQTTASQNQIQVAWSSTTDGGTYAKVFSWFDANGSNQYGGANLTMNRSEIWMATQWPSHNDDADFYFGGYGPTTVLHEIGHALGISHPGNYNAGAEILSYDANAEFAQDTHAYSLMSYWAASDDGSQTDHYGSDGYWKFPQTPMLYDVAVAQAVYGADTNTRTTNTTYGFNANAGKNVFNFSLNQNPILTLWDGGGIDTLDVSGYSVNQYLNLAAGKYSDVGAMTNNVAVALNTVIENAVGGTGSDLIGGNEVANSLSGNGGNDFILGLLGNDTIDGGAGIEDIVGFIGSPEDYTITYNSGVFTTLDNTANSDCLDLKFTG